MFTLGKRWPSGRDSSSANTFTTLLCSKGKRRNAANHFFESHAKCKRLGDFGRPVSIPQEGNMPVLLSHSDERKDQKERDLTHAIAL